MSNIISVNFIKFDTSEKRDFYNLSKYLTEEKREKINSFKSDADYNRSLYAEIIVRRFFIKKFSLNNSEINMKYDDFGKPYVENFSNIYFSISHSGNYITVAFDSKPIGIDVEKLKNFDYKRIINRYFKDFEKNYIFESNDEYVRLKRFYKIWTIKESYAKFKGTGLAKELNHFYVENFSNKKNEFTIKDKISNENYFAKSYAPDENYIFSVCSSKKNFDICLEKIEILDKKI